MDVSKLKKQFETMFGLPFRPTVHVYNEMMLSFFIRERFKDMFECLKEMRRSDVVPNRTTYTFMVKARVFEGDTASAHILLQEMNRLGFTPTLLHCALIFHSFCRQLLTSEAEDFLVEMSNVYHIRPNHVFYGSLIYAYTRRREYSKVFESFERMEKAGFVPDTETCNYVLISLLEINEYKEARKFFEKMLLQGIRRNNHTYTYLANGFLARRDDQSLMAILADCTAPGNSIDAFPFNQIQPRQH
jgi:pentatricopeptide repeat protein